MSISVTAIAKDLLTLASAAKVALGALAHKIYADLTTAKNDVVAEVKKVDADVKADVTAVEKKL